ncbi:hypothetical protein [Nosocomiicoccus sp. HMSC059G07]|uniref:type II restriction enzyme n=1 Tax=Nosocomiicoccus sp. HMSC059G07 TaxID=1739531 RepID=UPI0008A34FBB|nr:hypothetical protein [Nosocomiicoccus sp. HMSC059G07]OFO50865.1 hypothetical protein HMPREF3029_07925 [Nosocomiicoccus sp. HMSC059G07]
MTKSSKKVNKTDDAWNKLFEKYNIKDEVEKNGFFRITSTQINEFREARLMTKFDHSDQLPTLFSENNFSILPDTRGTYIIGRFKAYEKLKMIPTKPKFVKLPEYIETIDIHNITSEAVALNVAHASGMVDEVMNKVQNKDTSEKSVLTLTGRMSSGKLFYKINTRSKLNDEVYNFEVINSQVEIDGSYEDDSSIALIEAKAKVPKDFMIRQLYYPFRVINSITDNKKILPIFFTFADDVFYFSVYEFTDAMNYSSIKWKGQYSFILNENLNLDIRRIHNFIEKTPMKYEPNDVVYPQADNVMRLLDMIDYLVEPKSKEELAKEYEFNVRQSDYYANALVFLGLAQKQTDLKFSLSKLGQKIQKMYNSNERNKIIIECMLQYNTLRKAFLYYEEHGPNGFNKYVSGILLNNIHSIQSESTAKRRAGTVKGWIEWIYSVTSK